MYVIEVNHNFNLDFTIMNTKSKKAKNGLTLVLLIIFCALSFQSKSQDGQIIIENQIVGLKYVYEGKTYKRLNQLKKVLLATDDPYVIKYFKRFKKNQIMAPTFIVLGYISFMAGVASTFNSPSADGFVVGTLGGVTLFIIGLAKLPKIGKYARLSVASFNKSGRTALRHRQFASGKYSITLLQIPIGHQS